MIQEGVKSIEKGAHRGASARQDRRTLSLVQNKHRQNITTPKNLSHFRANKTVNINDRFSVLLKSRNNLGVHNLRYF